MQFNYNLVRVHFSSVNIFKFCLDFFFFFHFYHYCSFKYECKLNAKIQGKAILKKTKYNCSITYFYVSLFFQFHSKSKIIVFKFDTFNRKNKTAILAIVKILLWSENRFQTWHVFLPWKLDSEAEMKFVVWR